MTTHHRRRHRHHAVALAVLAVLDAPLLAHALPQGGQVVEGQVTIGAPAAGQLGITQGSARAVVDWRSFGIGANERVSLAQPAGGAALFRVTGSDPSQIFGSLSATGSLFLSNPNGVLFGAGARVDVGSLAATTLGMTNADFMAGRLKLAGDSRASVVNEGHIEAAPGGSVVLVGANVSNSGTIDAPQGSVALGAGSAATLDVYGNGLLKLNLTAGADGARVDHTGTITADGGTAAASAQGAGSALNIGGVVRARSLEQRGGAIYLTGGAGAKVNVTGTLDASGTSGDGGRIEVRAERIDVAAGAVLRADAGANGNGGTVDAIATTAMDYAGHLSARGGAAGGNGGTAEISGDDTMALTGTADLAARAGRYGTLLLDPGAITIATAGNDAGPNTWRDTVLAGLLANGNVTLATANATNNGDESIQVAAGANVTWATPTTLTLNSGRSTVVNAGAVIANTNAGATAFDAVVVNANQGATPASGNFKGVLLQGNARIETATGSIRITGRGGNTGDFNQGVLLLASTLRSVDGDIVLNGTGGPSAGQGSRGIDFSGDATVQATGRGNLTLTGNGGSGGGTFNLGVAFVGGTSTLSTASGNLRIEGNGSSPDGGSSGVASQTNTSITAGSGDITVQGSAAASNVFAVSFFGGTNTVGSAATTGNITLIGNAQNFSNLTARTAGDIAVRTFGAGRLIALGADDSTGNLGVSAAELLRLQAGRRLTIGGATADPINVLGPVAPAAGTGTLALVTPGQIDVRSALTGGSSRIELTGNAGVRLGAGVSSTAADPAGQHAIEVRATSSFINVVGPTALSTPNGSWSVSLESPRFQSFNGLVSGNPAVWSNPVLAAVNAAGNRYSFAIAPTIYLNAGADTKVYGDALSTSVTLADAPISARAETYGGVFTDYAGGTVSGTYTRTSGTGGLAATADVGVYGQRITDTSRLTTNLPGFQVAIGQTGSVTVNRRAVTLLPDAVSRDYGDANPARGSYTISVGSLANGNTITDVALSSPATAGSNVGSYALDAGGAAFGAGLASNYTITYARRDGGLTVTPRPVTLTLGGSADQPYGGGVANLAITAPTVTGGSLAAGDAVTGYAANATGPGLLAPVGTYGVQFVSVSLGNAANQNVTSNYAITRVDAPYFVTPRPVTLTPVAVSRPYGDANPATAGATSNSGFGVGLVNGDTVSQVGLSTAATPASNAGLYPTTGSNAVFASGAASNYTITYGTNANGLNVTPRLLTITPVAVSRTYGDANPATAGATGNNLVNGDTLASVTITSPATPASNVGTYPTDASAALFSSGLASNYTINYARNANGLDITPRPITLAASPVSRFYGDANPATGAGVPTVGTLVNGDTVASVTLGTPALVTSPVGGYDLDASNAVFGVGNAANYAISYVTTPVGLLINPRPVTLTPNPVSRPYGDANPAAGSASVTAGNLVNGDTLGTLTLASPADLRSGVGSYPLDGSNPLFTAGAAGNYAISIAPLAGGLTVTPRALTLTPNSTARPYGDANPTSFTAFGNAGGLVNGDSVASVTLSTSATPASNVGTYDTTGSNALFASGQAGNYTISYATNPTGLDVTPRALTLTPDATTRTYGDANPARGSATGSAGGLVNGDSVASVALASPAVANSGVGRYDLAATDALFGQGSASNYQLSYAPLPGGLQVTPRSVDVAARSRQSKVAGRPDPVFAYDITGGSLVAGDAFSGSLARAAGEALGSYPILQGTLALGPNYTLGYSGAPFTIAATSALPLVDRAPAPGAPATSPSDLLATLPPTAAGPAGAEALTAECVREAALGGSSGARLVNRGIRLPAGVADACRGPGAPAGS